ncbi:putative metal ion-binding protein [Sesbania bispinosa]|nr:putative metal ion-binding protein [Sesbania bispinosa]
MTSNTNMTCALKVDTRGKGWYETTSKILGKIRGVSYNLDAEKGMIYISGKVDPHKILGMIAKHGKEVDLCWMKTGDQYVTDNNDYGRALMSASAYPPYHRNRGFCPPPPPMAYYQQYHRYPPHLPYYY